MTSKPPSTFCPRLFFQQCVLHKLFQLSILSTVIVLIGGGIALLWEYHHGSQRSQAYGDVSVVGPPTLSAATVDAIFARVGSPMMGTGKVVEQASHQTNIDDAFALGVWWTETNDGAAGVGLHDRNPGSVRGSVGYPSAYDGYTIYPSYTAAISYWFKLISNSYVNRGLSTVYAIGRPYVGTTSYPLWASKVINLMYSYRGIAPPPPVVTPTSTPKPKPTVDPVVLAANKARQQKLTSLWQSLTDGSDGGVPLQSKGQIEEVVIRDSGGTQQGGSIPALPPTMEYAIILFGLLTALVLALYALRIGVPAHSNPTSHPTRATARVAPTIHELATATASGQWNPSFLDAIDQASMDGGAAPSTDDLAVLPVYVPITPGLRLPIRNPQTDALPRRIVLEPLDEDMKAAVATDVGVERSSGGLLSKYRETQQ